MVIAQDLAKLPGSAIQEPDTGEPGDIGPHIFLALLPQVEQMHAMLYRPIQFAVIVKQVQFQRLWVHLADRLWARGGTDVFAGILQENVPVLDTALVVKKPQVPGHMCFQVGHIALVETPFKESTIKHGKLSKQLRVFFYLRFSRACAGKRQ